MVEAFRCSQCSAPVEDDRWTNCSYCGAVLAKPTINPLRAAVAPERFTAVERSPGYEALLRRKPSGTGKLFGMAFQTAFLLVFIVVSGSMTVAFPAGLFAIVPGILCAVGIFLLVRTSSRAARFAGAVLERRVAVGVQRGEPQLSPGGVQVQERASSRSHEEIPHETSSSSGSAR